MATDPRPHGCRKRAGTSARYRLRVGDDCIIYRVDDGKVTVLVLLIGHRRDKISDTETIRPSAAAAASA